MFWLPLSERCTGSDIFKVVWPFHSRRYFLGKLRRHLYRRSSSFHRTQESLSSWSTANWSPRELYTYYHW
jgi:hypothetical protein